MRIALIADTHLAARAPECVANWHAAGRAVRRLGAELTVHLGDISLDGQTHADELEFASRLVQAWPTEMRCVPGNHDLGDGSGEAPLDEHLLALYGRVFGADHWTIGTGAWKLLGINAHLLGTGSAREEALWRWLEQQAAGAGADTQLALFLHRPLLRPQSGEQSRAGRYVASAAAERLLGGMLHPMLRLVVSGHTHQYLDTTVDGVRHLWLPSTAFVLPDTLQRRLGEKLVGLCLLELAASEARVDLWCPDGMLRHDVTELPFFAA